MPTAACDWRRRLRLVDHGAAVVEALTDVATKQQALHARLHAIWALGMIGRHSPAGMAAVQKLLDDDTAEVRAQAAKVLGDVRAKSAVAQLINRLKDDSPRVRLLAALALARFGDPKAVEPALAMCAKCRSRCLLAARRRDDPQHFGRRAVTIGFGERSLGVRTVGRALVVRRLRAPEITRFLNDASPRLVAEAALAIHDVPIDAAEPQLAGLLERSNLTEPALWRTLNANFRIGGASRRRPWPSLPPAPTHHCDCGWKGWACSRIGPNRAAAIA